MKMEKNGLKCWKCMELMFFRIDTSTLKVCFVDWLNIANYGWSLRHYQSASYTVIYQSLYNIAILILIL